MWTENYLRLLIFLTILPGFLIDTGWAIKGPFDCRKDRCDAGNLYVSMSAKIVRLKTNEEVPEEELSIPDNAAVSPLCGDSNEYKVRISWSSWDSGDSETTTTEHSKTLIRIKNNNASSEMKTKLEHILNSAVETYPGADKNKTTQSNLINFRTEDLDNSSEISATKGVKALTQISTLETGDNIAQTITETTQLTNFAATFQESANGSEIIIDRSGPSKELSASTEFLSPDLKENETMIASYPVEAFLLSFRSEFPKGSQTSQQNDALLLDTKVAMTEATTSTIPVAKSTAPPYKLSTREFLETELPTSRESTTLVRSFTHDETESSATIRTIPATTIVTSNILKMLNGISNGYTSTDAGSAVPTSTNAVVDIESTAGSGTATLFPITDFTSGDYATDYTSERHAPKGANAVVDNESTTATTTMFPKTVFTSDDIDYASDESTVPTSKNIFVNTESTTSAAKLFPSTLFTTGYNVTDYTTDASAIPKDTNTVGDIESTTSSTTLFPTTVYTYGDHATDYTTDASTVPTGTNTVIDIESSNATTIFPTSTLTPGYDATDYTTDASAVTTGTNTVVDTEPTTATTTLFPTTVYTSGDDATDYTTDASTVATSTNTFFDIESTTATTTTTLFTSEYDATDYTTDASTVPTATSTVINIESTPATTTQFPTTVYTSRDDATDYTTDASTVATSTNTVVDNESTTYTTTISPTTLFTSGYDMTDYTTDASTVQTISITDLYNERTSATTTLPTTVTKQNDDYIGHEITEGAVTANTNTDADNEITNPTTSKMKDSFSTTDAGFEDTATVTGHVFEVALDMNADPQKNNTALEATFTESLKPKIVEVQEEVATANKATKLQSCFPACGTGDYVLRRLYQTKGDEAAFVNHLILTLNRKDEFFYVSEVFLHLGTTETNHSHTWKFSGLKHFYGPLNYTHKCDQTISFSLAERDQRNYLWIRDVQLAAFMDDDQCKFPLDVADCKGQFENNAENEENEFCQNAEIMMIIIGTLVAALVLAKLGIYLGKWYCKFRHLKEERDEIP